MTAITPLGPKVVRCYSQLPCSIFLEIFKVSNRTVILFWKNTKNLGRCKPRAPDDDEYGDLMTDENEEETAGDNSAGGYESYQNDKQPIIIQPQTEQPPGGGQTTSIPMGPP